jgi:hypothetical protein
MARKSRLLLVLVLLGGTLPLPEGRTQETAPAPKPLDAGSPPAPELLPGLPKPLLVPESLTQPAPPALYSCEPTPRYFETHPLLDPPQLPPPGWIAGVELDTVVPHLMNHLLNTVQIGARAPDVVTLPSAPLDWTVAPRVEVGYRLPAGFGEFALGYRFLASQGTTHTPFSLDGAAVLHSRLDFNQADADYVSREISLWPQFLHLDMKWRLGVRLAFLYFDSRGDEAFDVAAAGSGVFDQRVSGSYWGIGPHAGVELARRIDGTGLALVGSVDFTDLFGRVRQGFFEKATMLDEAGLPLTGETRASGTQDVPILNLRLGVSWTPPEFPSAQVFIGYQYEYWWNVGKVSTTGQRGAELSDQGVTVRAEITF